MIMSGGVRLRRVTPWPYNDRPSDFSLPDFGLSPKDQQRLADDAWRCLVKGEDDLRRLVETDILPVLTRHGLRPEWDGDLDTRILINNAQWYMPLPEQV
jgi:hypothetical protein